MPKIADVYFTRIVNTKEKKYGFGILMDGQDKVYIPARVVERYDLEENDIGTLNKAILMESENDGSDWHIMALTDDDGALQLHNEVLREEVASLRAVLKENGISAEGV